MMMQLFKLVLLLHLRGKMGELAKRAVARSIQGHPLHVAFLDNTTLLKVPATTTTTHTTTTTRPTPYSAVSQWVASAKRLRDNAEFIPSAFRFFITCFAFLVFACSRLSHVLRAPRRIKSVARLLFPEFMMRGAPRWYLEAAYKDKVWVDLTYEAWNPTLFTRLFCNCRLPRRDEERQQSQLVVGDVVIAEGSDAFQQFAAYKASAASVLETEVMFEKLRRGAIDGSDMYEWTNFSKDVLDKRYGWLVRFFVFHHAAALALLQLIRFHWHSFSLDVQLCFVVIASKTCLYLAICWYAACAGSLPGSKTSLRNLSWFLAVDPLAMITDANVSLMTYFEAMCFVISPETFPIVEVCFDISPTWGKVYGIILGTTDFIGFVSIGLLDIYPPPPESFGWIPLKVATGVFSFGYIFAAAFALCGDPNRRKIAAHNFCRDTLIGLCIVLLFLIPVLLTHNFCSPLQMQVEKTYQCNADAHCGVLDGSKYVQCSSCIDPTCFMPELSPQFVGNESLWSDFNGCVPWTQVETFADAQNVVYGVSLSLDGQWLATGSWDNKARVYYRNAMSDRWQLKNTFTDASDRVYRVSLSSDGQWLAAGSMDRKVRVYHRSAVSDGWKLSKTLADATDGVDGVSLSLDGQWLATGSWDNKARVYHHSAASDSWTLVKTFTDATADVHGVSLSSDGQWLATASLDREEDISSSYYQYEARVYHHNAASNSWMITFTAKEVKAVTLSSDGLWLATGSTDRKARVYHRSAASLRWKLVSILKDATDSVDGVSLNSDGEWLATRSLDKKARIYHRSAKSNSWWSTDQWRLVKNLSATDVFKGISMSPDGLWLATGFANHTACVYHPAQ